MRIPGREKEDGTAACYSADAYRWFWSKPLSILARNPQR